jgi:hypothetical protein
MLEFPPGRIRRNRMFEDELRQRQRSWRTQTSPTCLLVKCRTVISYLLPWRRCGCSKWNRTRPMLCSQRRGGKSQKKSERRTKAERPRLENARSFLSHPFLEGGIPHVNKSPSFQSGAPGKKSRGSSHPVRVSNRYRYGTSTYLVPGTWYLVPGTDC